jgi:tRNA uridine 5-carboxymethylaminomethyl modification enzyme
LISDSQWEKFNTKRDKLARLRNYLDNEKFKRSSIEYSAVSNLTGLDLGDSFTLSQLSMRQCITPEMISRFIPKTIENINLSDIKTALADSLYSGYIASQKSANERVNHNDSLKIPVEFKYSDLSGLSNEMIERLERSRPQTFEQVRKIPGLTPAAISTVLVNLTSRKKSN